MNNKIGRMLVDECWNLREDLVVCCWNGLAWNDDGDGLAIRACDGWW
jgi:hypothetical protein